MKPIECEFEAEVLSAALQSRWPKQVSADLREHVAACEICSDVAAVAGAMDAAREDTNANAVIPDSGRVWWVAQLRARREAAKTAGRPITAIQVISFACAMGLFGACFGATSAWFQSALGSIVEGIAGFGVKTFFISAISVIAGHTALVVTTAALLFLIPAVVYLAIARE